MQVESSGKPFFTIDELSGCLSIITVNLFITETLAFTHVLRDLQILRKKAYCAYCIVLYCIAIV